MISARVCARPGSTERAPVSPLRSQKDLQHSLERGLKLVAIGGGTGLSTALSGLKELVGDQGRGGLWLEALSAIVTVSDDGGSSGRLREELQMLPPGDIRNCMVALSCRKTRRCSRACSGTASAAMGT